MPVISLLTDFGTHDAYVGVMKGVILSITPSARVVDITHEVAPQDIAQAAYIIETSFRYFPPATVHLVVVDPGVGSHRAILAMEMGGYRFVAPDNGVMTRVLKETEPDTVVRVEHTDLFLKPISRTFHGRDVFAPVGAHLAGGLDISELGPRIPPSSVLRLQLEETYVSADGHLVGTVIHVDRFGNLVTNITPAELERFCPGKKPVFRVGERSVVGISDAYSDVKLHTPLSLVGSSGFVELSINGGSAASWFGAGKGASVTVGHR